jgi:hypothetical protein
MRTMPSRPLTPRRRSLVEVAVLLLPLAPLGCTDDASAREERSVATAADGVATGVSVSEARFIRNIIGFQGPESVRYDPDLDAFFVSNMTGYGSAQDRNGYIVRISASNPDSATILAQGGVNGVVLDAPKGLAVHGDTLWATGHLRSPRVRQAYRRAARHDRLRAARRRAAQRHRRRSRWTLHVTDTGIIMSDKGTIHVGPDRVYVVGPNQSVTIAAEGTQLGRPNGITWDDANKRWIVISFDPFNGQVMVNPQGHAKPQLIRTGRASSTASKRWPTARCCSPRGPTRASTCCERPRPPDHPRRPRPGGHRHRHEAQPPGDSAVGSWGRCSCGVWRG